MERYGAVLNIAVPIFLLLFLIEKIVEWRRGESVIRSLDSVSSFSSGITNVVKDILGLSVGILSYDYMVNHWAIIQIEHTAALYFIAFIVKDFHGYWTHKWNHSINFLWNRHIIHHSSEEFNLSCALRQSVSNIFSYFTILFLPAALLGVPTLVVATVAPLHLFLQYWYHTRLIGKMGWLEKIIVTPSHHRVHHAINPIYLDKNLGEVFIFWDKLFGTFQPELESEPPVYGVTRPVKTWNPFRINFQHFALLFRDAWHTKKGMDKLLIWFKPLGWRPEDVKERFPIETIKNPQKQVKWQSPEDDILKIWSWTQMFFNYFLLVYFFLQIGNIGSPQIFIYGGFVFLSIFAYTELMDGSISGVILEVIKSILGLSLIYNTGDWFGVASFWPWYLPIVIAYLIFSMGFVPIYWFYVRSRVRDLRLFS